MFPPTHPVPIVTKQAPEKAPAPAALKRSLFGLLVLGLGAGLQAATMTISSLSGPVTQDEINSFKTFMQAEIPPPNSWTAITANGVVISHNCYADGTAGREVDAMGMMYEVSGDIQILNRMIFFVDSFVSTRNDLMSAANGGQRVMWTGQIDKVWCPEAPTNAHAQYAGSETEDAIERMAYCAKEILQTPSLWNTTVPDGNPHGYGVTYLDRARTYVTRCDESNDEYFLKWFVQSGTNLIRPPVNQPAWTALDENVNAINRQMMFDGGYQRLAECHEILGDNPARVAQYDAIVKASVTECLAAMKNYGPHQIGGQTVYNWSYYPTSTTGTESVGHAAYDMVGIYRAFSRSVYGVSLSDVTPFGNTLVSVISLGNNTFSGNVDGSSTTQNYMLGEWLPVADWNPTVYTLIAGADLASGRSATTAHLDASILWMKNRRALGATVGTPTFSPAAGTYTGTHTVTISTATPGSSIRYTTSGSAPTAYSGTLYTGPIAVSSNTTIKAIAYHLGLTDSAVSSASYTINIPLAAAPSFSPVAGTYTSTQIVTITSATSGASLRYTIDGSAPTETHGTVYSSPVSISATTTLKAIAYESGFTDSAVSSATYTINTGGPITLEAENLSPVGSGATVSISNDANASGGVVEFLNSTAVGQIMTFTTSGIPAGTYQVQLRYSVNTTRGQHTVKIDGTQLGGTIDQYAAAKAYVTTTLGTVTFASSGTHSIAMTVTGKNSAATQFYLTADTFTFTPVQPQAVAPSFTPAAGTYSSAQNVTVTSSTSGATLRYTTDGSTPSETAGSIYSGPVNISSTKTLKAIAYKTGFTDSTVTSGTYTITITPPPTLNFEAESISPVGTGATVSISNDANASGGVVEFLNSTAAGQIMTFTTPSIPAGTYQVQLRYSTNTTRGQHTVKINGTQIGGTIDQYATAKAYVTTTLGTVTFASAGTHSIALTVTGKNSAATQFYLTADKFTFVGQ